MISDECCCLMLSQETSGNACPSIFGCDARHRSVWIHRASQFFSRRLECLGNSRCEARHGHWAAQFRTTLANDLTARVSVQFLGLVLDHAPIHPIRHSVIDVHSILWYTMSTSCIQLPPHITLSETFKTFGLGPARSQASLLPVLKLQSLGACIPVISCFYLTSFKSYPICCSVWPWVTPLTNINQPTSWLQPGARRFLRFLRFLVFCRPTWVPPITMTATDFTFWSFWLRAALQSRDLLRLDSSTPQEIQDALTCCFSGFTIFLISLQKLVFGARRKKEKTWKNNTSQMIPLWSPMSTNNAELLHGYYQNYQRDLWSGINMTRGQSTMIHLTPSLRPEQWSCPLQRWDSLLPCCSQNPAGKTWPVTRQAITQALGPDLITRTLKWRIPHWIIKCWPAQSIEIHWHRL